MKFVALQKTVKVHSQRSKKSKKDPDRPKVFGDKCTADHFCTKKHDSLGVAAEKFALVMCDLATNYVGFYADAEKSGLNATHAFNHFAGPEPKKKIKSFRSDNAPEILWAAKDLGVNHCTSTPERSQTNSKAERKVRHVLEGARCSLFQSGLPLCFWNFAGEHFCHAENIRNHKDDDGNPKPSAWELRTHKKFEGLRIPLGAAIDYLPPPSWKTEKMDKTTIEGVFLGWKLNPGAKYERDYYVAPLSEFNQDTKRGKTKN